MEDAPPPAPSLAERMRFQARFLQAVADRLEAIEEEDPARLAQVNERLRTLEAELQTLGEPLPDGASLHGALDAAQAQLAEKAETAQMIEARWAVLEDGAFKSIRSIARTPFRGGRYAEPSRSPRQVDRRF